MSTYEILQVDPEGREWTAKSGPAAGKTFATPSQRYNAGTGPSYECADVPDVTYSDDIETDLYEADNPRGAGAEAPQAGGD